MLQLLLTSNCTARGAAIAAVIANYSSLLIALDKIVNECCGQDFGKKARRVLEIMDHFDYIFALLLGDQLFGSVETLSRTLQSTSMSAAGEMAAVNVEVAHLCRIRSDEDVCSSLDARRITCIRT